MKQLKPHKKLSIFFFYSIRFERMQHLKMKALSTFGFSVVNLSILLSYLIDKFLKFLLLLIKKILCHYGICAFDTQFTFVSGLYSFNLSFTTVFQHDDLSHQLAATSETERDLWIQALHMASFEYMRSQLSSLKEKLSKLKVLNDNDSSRVASKRQRSFTSVSSKLVVHFCFVFYISFLLILFIYFVDYYNFSTKK